MTTIYNRDQKDRLKNRVEQCLASMMTDGYGGYDVLRYVEQGLIEIKPNVNPNVFTEWYPSHSGYIFLRLAKAGKLQYKEQCENGN